MTSYFSLTDLFLTGLAFDICGTILLAKGLLLSPRMLAKLNTYWGLSSGQPQDRLENRVAGEFGVAYLVFGFLFQAIGYCLNIAGVHDVTGVGRLIAGLALGVMAAAVAYGGWTFGHGPRLRGLEAAVGRESTGAQEEISRENTELP